LEAEKEELQEQLNQVTAKTNSRVYILVGKCGHTRLVAILEAFWRIFGHAFSAVRVWRIFGADFGRLLLGCADFGGLYVQILAGAYFRCVLGAFGEFLGASGGAQRARSVKSNCPRPLGKT